MAEYLAGGEKSVARAIFFFSLRAQIAIALLMMSIGLSWCLPWWIRLPLRRDTLVATMLPRMLTFIPSMRIWGPRRWRPIPAALSPARWCTCRWWPDLFLRWDLVGIACAVF